MAGRPFFNGLLAELALGRPLEFIDVWPIIVLKLIVPMIGLVKRPPAAPEGVSGGQRTHMWLVTQGFVMTLSPLVMWAVGIGLREAYSVLLILIIAPTLVSHAMHQSFAFLVPAAIYVGVGFSTLFVPDAWFWWVTAAAPLLAAKPVFDAEYGLLLKPGDAASGGTANDG